MNKEYLIMDSRPIEEFKDKTFSNFKKKDVINELFKSIEHNKLEEACNWITECIISGYCEEIFEKLVLFNSNNININNPNLPILLSRKHKTFVNSFNHLTKKDKDKIIHLRNTQSVRNLFFDIIFSLIDSSKEIKFNKHKKLKNEDFQFHNIKNKLKATMHILPSNIIRFTDPDELKIIMNEFYFHLKNENGGYYDACYWVDWLFQWEKISKKNKKKYEIESRDINNINPKYCKDPVWLLWEIIFLEANRRNDNIKNIIQNIYYFFNYNFTPGKKRARIVLIYHCISCLTYKINTNIPIHKNKNLFIQTQCNINIMFKNKKLSEVKNYVHIPKINKKNYINEINLAKSNLIN